MGYTTVTVSCKIAHWVVVQNTNACIKWPPSRDRYRNLPTINYRKLTHRQLLLTVKVTYIVIRKFFSTLQADSGTLYIIPFFTFVTLNPGSTMISEVFSTYWAFTVWLRLGLRTQKRHFRSLYQTFVFAVLFHLVVSVAVPFASSVYTLVFHYM